FLGPGFSRDCVIDYLEGIGARYQRCSSEPELLREVVDLLAAEKVVGWFHGRMEFGPRALGARSIIGDPRSPKMQANMNLKIKFRESFRPFAPSVLSEEAHHWFELESGQESPYMLLVAPVLAEHRLACTAGDVDKMTTDPDLRHRVNVVRSTIPAV